MASLTSVGDPRVVDVDIEAALQGRDDRPVLPPCRRPVLVGAFLATTAAALFRWGYAFGYFDQTVLSVRGIALADPHAFRGDWFAQTVPQPHWLFDVVTFAGERLGILPWVYLAYWLAGIAVFSLGAVWITERFLPHRPGWAVLLGPLVVLGPQKILGSSGPIGWFAIPQMLGGCLAFLALAALLTGRWRAAIVAAVLTGAVHVQHGADLAPVLFLAAALPGAWRRRPRVAFAATGIALLAGAQAVAAWRGLDTSGQAWLDACRVLIPYHCYAPAWQAPYLAGGGVVLAFAFLFAWSYRNRWPVVGPAVLLPAAGLLVAVTAERFRWGELGRLAQQYNAHRLVTFVVPFSAFGVLILLDRLASPGRRIAAVALRAALAGGLVLFWSSMTEEPASRGFFTSPSLIATGFSLAVAAWVYRCARPGERAPRLLRPGLAVVVSVALLPAVALAAAQGTFGHLGIDTGVPGIRAALAIGARVPETAVIAAPPEIFWLRLVARRAVVADCKSGPYGGALWEEYLRRLHALGDGCTNFGGAGFRGLPVAQVEALRERYGVTHVLLDGDDPKLAYARAHWRLVYETPPQSFPYMDHGWVVFDLTSP
jgi:hypothetical protein